MAARFEKVCSVVSNGVVPVTKYKSPKSGLTVCIADVGGPLVNGFFCLATEAHDDDGLPHTLEHLVFLGSEDYPYKGVLDMLANRCLAQGTNAWTDTDHTCYTVMTAGSQGFLNLLPIYLDHVLYPTLTDAGYVTEVHHINGEGEDAGVVYCEMQARENSGESRTHLAMLRAMYPGHCGYKSETGGIMANLRTSTSNEKVRDYHKEFYRPENLCLVITGQVDHEAVFKVLEPFEEKIEKKGALPPYVRPWQNAVPPLSETVVQTVKYATDDEANGLLSVAWRGPESKELYNMSGLMIMLEYLTDTAVSPLQRDFVEIDDPYCSKVRYSIIEATESCFYIKFDNVPSAKLSLIKDKLFSVLGKLESGKEAVDMERMQSVIHRNILEALNHMEDQPHETFAFMCIGDFLYGNNEQELKQRLNQIDDFKKLQTESTDFWTAMLKKYIIDAKYVNIVGEASKKTAETMSAEEKQRIEKQRESLGEKGLKEKEELVEEATDENEKEAPEEMMSCLPVPDTSTMNFHNLTRLSNMDSEEKAANGLDLEAMPFTFCVDDILTNFVMIQAIFDTACVPDELKPYLPLYLDLLFESPVVRDGVVISHQDIVTQLAADTLGTGACLSVSGGSRFRCGTFAQVAEMEIKVEVEKYSQGVKWLKELMHQIKFTEERLKIVATKMMNSVSKMKRDGRTIAVAVLRDMNFNKESNHHVANFLRQHKFLTGLVKRLETDAEAVINDMTKLRDVLTTPGNLRIHMTANMKKLSEAGNPQLPWEQHFISKQEKPDKRCTTLSKRTHELLQNKSSPSGTIVGVGSVESQFLIQTVPCVTDYTDADLAPIMVYIEYLCALEGPMWKQIRGLGLAYHYRMYCLPEQGLLYFQLFKATHVVNAYKQAKEIVDGYLTGKTPFDEVQLETTISSVLYEIIEREETVSSTSEESLLNYFRGTSQDYNRTMLGLISKVTVDDLKRVGERYFRPMFDVTKSRCAVSCPPNKVEEIKKSFKQFSRDLTVMSSLEEGFQ